MSGYRKVGSRADHTLEGSLIRHIVDKQYAHCPSVVGCRDRSESFLTSSIPYLKLYTLAVQLDCTDLEINADGGDERRGKRILAEPQ